VLRAVWGVRAMGVVGVRGRGVPVVRVTARVRRPRLGAGEAPRVDARPRCFRFESHDRDAGPRGGDDGPARGRVAMGLEQLDHSFLTGRVEDLVKWARRNSVWAATVGLACCST